ncbi:MAG: hypothetical protein K0V04_33800 [Deltaproteobacteria bacterium]|nr:hypothetical protein [Deltaproteobacteria bacterium]
MGGASALTPWRCDAGRPNPGRPGTSTGRHRSSSEDRSDRLRCRACGEAITESDARTEIAGSHAHTFVNPAGLVFEIGCFARAPGCVGVGEPQPFFSWFPGYAWRVAACGGCRAHLGWSYGDGPQFHGLILDRLVTEPTARP